MTLILFLIYTSALIQWDEERVSGVEDLFFEDDVRWVAMGNNVQHLIRQLKACS